MEQSERLQRFGRAVRRARNKLSQAAFAQRIGISQTALSAWERGAAMPDPDLVFEAERQLGIEPGGLSGYLGFIPFDAATLPDPETEFTEDHQLAGGIAPTGVVHSPAVLALSAAELQAVTAATQPMVELFERIGASIRALNTAMEPSMKAMEKVQQAISSTTPSPSITAALKALEDVQRQQQESQSWRDLTETLSRLSAISEQTQPKTKRSTKKND